MLFSLVRRSAARALPVLAGLMALLSLFQGALVLMARTVERSRSIETLLGFLPMVFQRSLGSGLEQMASFAGIVQFGFVHPVVVLALAQLAAYLALDPAIEVEQGLVDLILARPFARHWLITRSLLVMFGGTVAVVSVMTVGLFGSLWSFARVLTWPRPTHVIAVAVNLIAVAWSFGAFGLLVAASARRAASAFGVTAVVALSSYLLQFVSASWPPAARLAPLSPFHYYQGMAIEPGSGAQLHDLAILCALTLLLSAAAYWRFGRRDL